MFYDKEKNQWIPVVTACGDDFSDAVTGNGIVLNETYTLDWTIDVEEKAYIYSLFGAELLKKATICMNYIATEMGADDNMSQIRRECENITSLWSTFKIGRVL